MRLTTCQDKTNSATSCQVQHQFWVCLPSPAPKLAYREQVLQDVADALAKRGCEVLENQVRVRLRERADCALVADVMPRHLLGTTHEI